MKVVGTETTLDKKRLIFYFTADGRIDFRELVRDLASKFKTRIEMRQIGVRDEVKIIGGIGACGRQTCCSLFLTSFEPITIRMAKEQELSINQSKLSGICGRLMCCLSYEHKDTNGETEKLTTREAAPVSVVKKASVDVLQPSDSATTQTKDQSKTDMATGVQPRETEGKPGISQEKEEAVVSSRPEEVVEERKPQRRKRRRRRRSRAGKGFQERPTQERPPQEKPESAVKTRDTEPKQAEQKGKGKPFSKRRKFWEKKKH
jgi:hypothetical protein